MADTTIHDILAQFRDEELHNRHLGDRFERLICRYLELDPIFADQFSNVWMWNEWPKKGNTGDIGIDIVAEDRATGEFCGIQCKFYLPDHTLSKDDIDSFLNALGDKRFTSGIIISTTSAKELVRSYTAIHAKDAKIGAPARMTVVFSTYHSIQAVADAQKAGLSAFDLIICDEAHRTTCVTLAGQDESHFVKIHDADFIKDKTPKPFHAEIHQRR